MPKSPIQSASDKPSMLSFPGALVSRARKLIAPIKGHCPELLGYGRVTVTSVLRLAAARGLRSLEADVAAAVAIATARASAPEA